MDNPSTTSTVICALAGGRWNVGLSKENEYAYDIAVPLMSRRDTHIVDRLAKLLTVFGVKPEAEKLEIRYVLSSESDRFARRYFAEQGLGVRFWGVANFHLLIARLLEELPSLQILILYHPADRRQAEEIARPFDGVLLSPATHSFDEFAAVVKLLGMLVTPDTSAVHLAAAFHIPAVVLYVQSNKELRIWEPYGSVCETLVTDMDDLATIPPDRVFDAIERLMKKARPGALRLEVTAAKPS
jgi:ADP-heptose:LPS heptosyltransferase